MPTDALRLAVANFRRGRQSFGFMVDLGIIRREGPHYILAENQRRECCMGVLWSYSLTQHLASAKHIALVWGVDRMDLLKASYENFMEARNAG